MFDEKTQAALQLADEMAGESWALDSEMISTLRAYFLEEELAEIVLLCGQANLNNRAGNAAKQLLGP